jgi:hypothetical protein
MPEVGLTPQSYAYDCVERLEERQAMADSGKSLRDQIARLRAELEDLQRNNALLRGHNTLLKRRATELLAGVYERMQLLHEATLHLDRRLTAVNDEPDEPSAEQEEDEPKKAASGR